MIFALTLLLPLLALAVWAFWRLSPQPADPRPVLWFNWTVTVLSLAICVAVVIYVRRTMTGSTDHAWWPVVSAFYGLVAIPLCLAVGGGIRRLIFGRREAAKPLEISQDLSKTRF